MLILQTIPHFSTRYLWAFFDAWSFVSWSFNISLPDTFGHSLFYGGLACNSKKLPVVTVHMCLQTCYEAVARETGAACFQLSVAKACVALGYCDRAISITLKVSRLEIRQSSSVWAMSNQDSSAKFSALSLCTANTCIQKNKNIHGYPRNFSSECTEFFVLNSFWTKKIVS